MKTILLALALALSTGLAYADAQRCIGMKQDAKRLACFDAEVKLAPTSQALADERPAPRRATSYSDNTCHTGPRGGRYRIVNGYKRYGC